MGDFVSYELAQKLESKGFRSDGNYGYNEKGEICVPVYNIDEDQLMTMTPCPEIHEVLKWLREEKKLHIEVMFIRPLHNRVKYYITDTDGSRGDFMDVSDEHYETWEQATLAGIEYVLNKLI